MLAGAAVIVVLLNVAPLNTASAAHHRAAPPPDVVADFRTLAQQKPWACPSDAKAADAIWPDGDASCAWQNRLRRQSWTLQDDTGACLSAPARWWNRAQAGLPATAPRSVWDRRWTAQVLRLDVGAEQRLLVLERDKAQRWQATEWRWNPNPRPATRSWQQARWQQLLDAVTQRQRRRAAAAAGDARMTPVYVRALGTRPGEFDADGLTLAPGGLCVHASNPLPGHSKLPLSYSPNDSRLEQRTAMHLQLSRQIPNAQWLTSFKLLDQPANRPGGAKFLATWIEGGQVDSQLWIPLKGDANTVRVRMSAKLPQGRADDATAARIKQVLEHELEGVATQWAAAYE